MNAKSTVVAIALAIGAASAVAIEGTQPTIERTTLSRAEVLAELARARANGELQTRNETYGTVVAKRLPASDLTRAAVRAEAQTHAQRGLSRGNRMFGPSDYIGG